MHIVQKDLLYLCRWHQGLGLGWKEIVGVSATHPCPTQELLSGTEIVLANFVSSEGIKEQACCHTEQLAPSGAARHTLVTHLTYDFFPEAPRALHTRYILKRHGKKEGGYGENLTQKHLEEAKKGAFVEK